MYYKKNKKKLINLIDIENIYLIIGVIEPPAENIRVET
jgi:hypothetical protein